MRRLIPACLAIACLVPTATVLASVDARGAFNHAIEIDLPDAVGMMRPQLELSYDSRAANGLLGMGWSLDGLPVITRANFGAGVNYDAQDTFFGPDGRLLNFNGTHAYRAEDETWTRYVPHNADGSVWTGSGGCGNGPCYWKATRPNGETIEFGATADSRIEALGRGGAVREWAVSRVSDPSGNFYTVTYYEDAAGGDYRPTFLMYNQGNGRTKLYTVEFAYEARADHGWEYSQSAGVDLDRRMKWITVATNHGQLIRKYRLDYEQGATTGVSRLLAVQEYGRDGTSTLPAERFEWQEGTRTWAGMAGAPGWGQNSGFTNAGAYPVYVGDWNGDGRTDFGRAHNTGTAFNVSTASGWQAYPGDWDGGLNRGFTDADRYPVLTGDWNGDGKTDFGRVNDAGIFFRVSTGSGWAGYPNGPPWGPNGGYTGANRYPLLIGDWNGDGKTDIGRVFNGGVTFFVSTGSGWQHYADDAEGGPNRGFSDADRYPVLIGDWNGDGKTDFGRVHDGGIYFRVSTGSGWRAYADGPTWGPNQGFVNGNVYPMLTGDWNGDGRTDIGRVFNNGTAFMVSSGAGWVDHGFGPNWSTATGFTDGNRYPIVTGDWNADGRTDIGRVHNGGVGFMTSTGTGWDAFGDWADFGPHQHFTDAFTYPIVTGDWSGEGKSGVARIGIHGLHVFTRAGAVPDLLTRVTNVFGGTTTVTYQLATLVPNAVRPDLADCIAPAPSPAVCGIANPGAAPLATRVSVADGRGNAYSTRYEYHNLRYLPGIPSVAENLGFAWVRSVDEQLGTARTITYRQDKPYHGRVSAQETFAAGGALMQRTRYDYLTVASAAGTRQIRAAWELEENYEFGTLAYRTRMSYDYDTFGNLTRASDENDLSTTNDDVHALAAYVNDTAQWRIGYPWRQRTCADLACDQVLRDQANYYDGLAAQQVGARGLLTTRAEWRSDAAAWLYTRYAYDASGNVTSVVDAANVTALRNEYDASSGTLVRSSDAVNLATSHAHDPVTGALTATTDPNGNLTRFSYDTFGRRVRVDSPHDGTISSVVEETLSFAPNLHVLTEHGERGPLVTTRHLDGLGRVWKTTRSWDNGALLQTDSHYDGAGRQFRACAPHRATTPEDAASCTTSHYDAAGRVVRVDSPRSGGGFVSTTTSYAGYRTVTTDAAGHATAQDYDPATLTRTLAQPGDLVTAMQEDLLGRTVRVTDPAGNVATYSYNSLDWKLREVDPVTGTTTFAHDALGRLISRTDAAGATTNFYYDAAGRRLRTDYAPLDATNAGPEDALFKYDSFWSPGDIANGKGRLVSVRDRSSGSIFAFDPSGRVRAAITEIDGVQYASSTTYDRTGRRTSVTYPDGSVAAYRYETDAAHLSAITLDGVEVMRYADYNERGAPTRLTYGSNIEEVSLTFEAATGELLQQQDTRGFRNSYFSYDERGMLVREQDLRSNRPNGDTTKVFAYDPLGQLVGAAMGADAGCSAGTCAGAAWSRRYTYDHVGRVTEKDGRAFTYDATRAFQLKRVAGEGADRTYDAAGRLLTKSSAGGVLETYVNGADGFLQEHRRGATTLHRMTYDYLGNRVKKEYLGPNAQTTWDLGSYKIIHDQASGKYYHTLYVLGLHDSRIAHRTTEKPGMVAAAALSSFHDTAVASLFDAGSVGGSLPWATHQSAATFAALVRDLDGARGPLAALAALAFFLTAAVLAVRCALQLAGAIRARVRRVRLPRPRFAWAAPAALAALAAGCVNEYETVPEQAAGADTISKDGRYGLLQALRRDGTNQPVPGTFYYLNSPRGSTSVMFDGQGAALLMLEYFPDGQVNEAASQGDYIASHTYGQKEYDKELEAYYNAFRYYDAQTMRFTTPDAIKESSDFLVHNLYAYTRNNPVNYTDATGFLTMRHDGGGGRSRPAAGSRVAPRGAMQIDGPSGPRATPRARTARYTPPARPTNRVRTDRFNRGPDGAAAKPATRIVAERPRTPSTASSYRVADSAPTMAMIDPQWLDPEIWRPILEALADGPLNEVLQQFADPPPFPNSRPDGRHADTREGEMRRGGRFRPDSWKDDPPRGYGRQHELGGGRHRAGTGRPGFGPEHPLRNAGPTQPPAPPPPPKPPRPTFGFRGGFGAGMMFGGGGMMRLRM